MSDQIIFPDDFPDLQTERIRLTYFSPEDVDAYYEMRSNEEFMKYLGKDPMSRKSEARDRVSSMIESFKRGEGISWKVTLKDQDELIGYVGFWRIDFKHRRAEVGFGLHADYRGKGLMTEAVETVVKFGFEKMKIHSIMADSDPRNQSSIALLEKIGFKKEAYLRENYYFNGEFLDSVYFGMLEKDLH